MPYVRKISGTVNVDKVFDDVYRILNKVNNELVTGGKQGATGLQGSTGYQGTTGIQGQTGLGLQGSTGIQGPTGTQGQTGIQGPIGNQGVTGAIGSTGVQGTTGIQGTTGAGIQGITGLIGLQGTQGTTGIQGTTGTIGLQGQTGVQGTTGLTGVTGLRGATGTGSQGVTGLNGVTGLQGSTGVQGSTGLQGAQGNTGPTGTTGLQGANGNQGATGLQGLTGSNGLQGSTGLRGATGLNGTNGSQGIQGVTGVQGIQGPQGPGGTGTTNTLTKFTNGAAGVIGNSAITDDGSIISVGRPINMGIKTISGNGSASQGLSFSVNATNNACIIGNTYNDGDSRELFILRDVASYAAGVGGGLSCWGKYNSNNNETEFASIKGVKVNATNGDKKGKLCIQTNSGSAPVTRLIIDESGILNLPSLTASRAVITDGSKNIVSSAVTSTELALLSDKNSVIDGSGTANYIPYFSAANRLTNSVMSHISNGVKIGIQSAGATATPSKIQFDLSFADTPVSSKAQIDLFGGYYGFGVTSSTLNYWSNGKHDYYSNNVKCMSINSKGINLGTENDPSTDQGNKWITWGVRADNNPYYCIRTNYETYGSYTYSRLQLNWNTGIEFYANKQYGGTRFFNSVPGIGTQIMSIGDGDNHVRVNNNLYATNLQASEGCYAYNTTTANTGTYIGILKYPGCLPGYSQSWPVLKTDCVNLNFAANNKHIGYWGSDGTTSYLGLKGQTGIVTTPDFIELGQSYINTSTVTNKSSKCKLFLYKDDINSDYYGLGIGNAYDLQYHSNCYHDFYISNTNVVSISGTGLIVTPTSYSTGVASIGASYGDYGFWFKKSSYFLDYGQKLDIADDYHFTILFNGVNRFRIQSDGTYTFGSATVSDVLTAGTRLVTNAISTADSEGFLTIGGAGATNAMVFINARLGHTPHTISGGSGTIPIYSSYVRLTYSGSSSTYTLGTPPETTVVTRVIVANKSTTAHTVNGRSISAGYFSEFVYDPYETAGWITEF